MTIEMFVILLLAINFIGTYIAIMMMHIDQPFDVVDLMKILCLWPLIFTAVELGLYALVKFTGILNFLS